MKIYGTAKGGALNKKDFGVAFGGAAPTPFSDDSDLKGYYKFNETSGDIVNQSESDESVGTSGNIDITGGDYDQDAGSPFEYSMEFDGTTSEFGVFGTSLTDWKFTHDDSGITTTICFWAKVNSTPASGVEEYFLSIINTDAYHGFMWRYNNNMAMQYSINSGNGSNIITEADYYTTSDYIPDTDSWHFYVIQFDISLASNNITVWRDAANKENFDKSGNTPESTNSKYALTVGARGSDHKKNGDFYICELSIWDRILTEAEIIELYNNGAGKAIYL